MSERHFLEKASWVAGIASAVIAAIVWLKPNGASEAIANQEPSPTSPVPSPIASGSVVNKPASAASSTISTRWSCSGIASDLRAAFNSAKNISYTQPKDQAFLSLARKALCLENYAMFEEAVNKISYTAPKDQAYTDGVDFALDRGKFDLAEKFASQIAYTIPQDAARARIVSKASER